MVTEVKGSQSQVRHLTKASTGFGGLHVWWILFYLVVTIAWVCAQLYYAFLALLQNVLYQFSVGWVLQD